MGRHRSLLIATVLWAISSWQTGTAKPIELRVPSHDCSAPCDMNVTVLIPEHPDNRSASVVWGYSDSTDLPLGGKNHQVQFTVAVGKFTKGDHTIYAVLARETNGREETFQDSQHISVR